MVQPGFPHNPQFMAHHPAGYPHAPHGLPSAQHPSPVPSLPSTSITSSEPEFLDHIFEDLPDFSNRLAPPSPPPLPADFHLNSQVGFGGWLSFAAGH